ncbi:hypothetical protein E0Z10_g10809 [Xylaria hypoxylon]|uniref:Uncharacterized protein n=1 Tax=Xylaria hypoxylon TaxID=37992 RepID=A0A4Z0YC52_9PEZI|nr:hypothetical protein E0Z10_g10809 [Xylaria hypoxylon]
MKANKALVAITASLLLNVTVTSAFAITSRDLLAPFKGISIDARGKHGSSSKGSGSGSGPNRGSKKSSRLNKGASTVEADAELSEWGMARTHDTEEAIGNPPTAFEWNSENNQVYEDVNKGRWEQYQINPDEKHTAEYGSGPIYSYQTNKAAGAFNTDLVATGIDLETYRARDLPTTRRALTYNAWLAAGGDPAKLKFLSDDNIINEDARQAFEDTFAAMGVDVSKPNQYIEVQRGNPAWAKWDNGHNPFPEGYETMTIDYTNMQSTTTSVTLFVDKHGNYHSVHILERVPDLERRLQTRAEYFMRRNLTDLWSI